MRNDHNHNLTIPHNTFNGKIYCVKCKTQIKFPPFFYVFTKTLICNCWTEHINRDDEFYNVSLHGNTDIPRNKSPSLPISYFVIVLYHGWLLNFLNSTLEQQMYVRNSCQLFLVKIIISHMYPDLRWWQNSHPFIYNISFFLHVCTTMCCI